MLMVSSSDVYPRVAVVRGAKRKGWSYYGPFAHAWAIRDTVDELLKVFPIRSCRDGVFRRAAQVGRPCLLGYIDKCSAPCVGRVSEQEYRIIVDDFCSFMSGQTDRFIREVELEMQSAAANQAYEEAARLRDRLAALTRATERNAVVFGDGTDADLIAIVEDPLELGVQVFNVRSGRIRGERGFVLEKAEDLDTAGYMSRVLQYLYADDPEAVIPREVLLSDPTDDSATWQGWLSDRRGSAVDLRVPQRGDKRALMETAQVNASNTLASHKTRRSGDLTTRSIALTEIQEAIGLGEAPLRIECIDISTLQGTDTVASLVVFEDGLPRKKDYRTFIIKNLAADDTAAVAEVVSRRFTHVDPDPQESEERKRFAYPPSLLVIDGGQPQVRAAQDALMAAGINDVPVIGLAKRLEEVWLPGESDPVILPRTSEGLYLLQRVRDEAHRVAISFHRKRRGKRSTASALDGIPGLGESKRKALLAHFGTVRAIKASSAAQLQEVSGIGATLAGAIYDHLHVSDEGPDDDASGGH
jgi:excinuclease ABC subunit C